MSVAARAKRRRKKARSAFADAVAYRSLQVAVALAGKLPEGALWRLSRLLGWLAPLATEHWRKAMENIQLVLGADGRNPGELRALGRAAFANLALTALEVARSCSRPELLEDDRFIISGLEHFRQAADRGKGVVLFTGHLGNWELAGAWFCRRMHPTTALARLQSNPAINRMIMENRRKLGVEILPKQCPWSVIRSFLADNYAIAFLADQHGGDSGIRVTFFGIPTTAPKGPILSALRTGATVVPAFTLHSQEKPFHHKICFEPPLQLVRTGNLEHDLQVNTQAALGVMESYIRRHPEQWLWMHRRWRETSRGVDIPAAVRGVVGKGHANDRLPA